MGHRTFIALTTAITILLAHGTIVNASKKIMVKIEKHGHEFLICGPRLFDSPKTAKTFLDLFLAARSAQTKPLKLGLLKDVNAFLPFFTKKIKQLEAAHTQKKKKAERALAQFTKEELFKTKSPFATVKKRSLEADLKLVTFVLDTMPNKPSLKKCTRHIKQKRQNIDTILAACRGKKGVAHLAIQ